MLLKSLTFAAVPSTLVLVGLSCAGEDPDATDPNGGMPLTSSSATNPGPTTTATGSAMPPTVQRESIAAKFAFTGAAPTFYEIDYLFGLSCATASCHTPIYFEPDLTNAYGDLYEILTTQPVAQCENNPLVVPGDIDNSAMMMLMYGQCSEFAMPLGCTEPPCLFEDYIQQFAHWINAGALVE